MPAPRVTYCVPAYNVQDVLEPCIASILDEGAGDIEVLVVNDASTDDTLNVAEKLAQRDPRLSLINHSYNMGLPSARNSAMQRARGEFIRHVDADDMITKGSTTHLLQMVGDADVARGSSLTFHVEGKAGYPMDWANHGIGNFAVEKILHSDFFRCNALGYVWLYMYRRKFLQDIGMPWFEEGLSILEDDIYNAEVLPQAKRVAITDKVIALYRSGGMSSGKHWHFRQYMEQASALAVVAQKIGHDQHFLSGYLFGKATFVIEKTKAARKAGLTFEEVCAYAEVIREIYLGEDIDHYLVQQAQAGSGVGSYHECDVQILKWVLAGQLDELYAGLDH